MNAPLDMEFWRESLTGLAIGSIGMIVLAAAVCFFVKLAQWRRMVWQICFVCLLFYTIAELAGITRGVSQWAAANREVQPQVLPLPQAADVRAPSFEVSYFDRPAGFVSEAANAPSLPAAPVRWPGFVWLAGFGLVMARVLLARLVCWRMRRRNLRADVELVSEMESVANKLGFRRRIVVLESPALTGPMAFGWLRPAVVLPSDFKRQYPAAQRQAMLAHELAHLAHRDPLWFLLGDLATALLWWNPLVWWARRRFRASCEEAADEASALAPDGRLALAEGLVALGRRLNRAESFAGLGIGGGGFRSGLGRRVARLLKEDAALWKPVRRRGRVLAGLVGCAVVVCLAFSRAWLLSATASEESLAGAVRTSWNNSAVMAVAAGLARSSGKEQRDTGEADVDAQSIGAPRGEAPGSATREALNAKLHKLRLNNISFDSAPLHEVLAVLNRKSIERDPEGKGVNFIIKDTPDEDGRSLREAKVHIVPPLRNIRLVDALHAVAVMSEQPIAFSVDAFGVGFERSSQQLDTRTYRFDPATLTDALDALQPGRRPIPNLSEALHTLLAMAGVDLSPPKALRVNERGIIMVRAAKEDLEIVQAVLDMLLSTRHQVTIQAVWVEVDANTAGLEGFGWLLKEGAVLTRSEDTVWDLGGPLVDSLPAEAETVNPLVQTVSAILTEAQYRPVLHDLKERRGVNVLSGPRVTTLSRRQAQIAALDTKPIVIGDADAAAGRPEIEIRDGWAVQEVRLGTQLDVLPEVTPPYGPWIRLNLSAQTLEFLDYDREANVPRPRFQAREISRIITVRDGQTVVLGGLADAGSPEAKNLFIFVTPVIHDPAGNRVFPEVP